MWGGGGTTHACHTLSGILRLPQSDVRFIQSNTGNKIISFRFLIVFVLSSEGSGTLLWRNRGGWGTFEALSYINYFKLVRLTLYK